MIHLRFFTKIQYKLFLNAVPHHSSLVGTWLLLIHMVLAFIGGPLLLIFYYGIGSSDLYFLQTIGLVGITLGIIIVIAVVSTLKIYRILGLFLLLVVYGLGTWFSLRIFNWSTILNSFNLLSFLHPFGLFIVFFPISGLFIIGVVLFTFYASITKKEVNFCYHCHTTYNFTDQFCESCGDLLLPCFISKSKPKIIIFSHI